MRVYAFKTKPAKTKHYDQEIGFATNWYLHNIKPDTTFYAELGYINSSKKFICLLSSNTVSTPPDKISNQIDESFLLSAADLKKLKNLCAKNLEIGASLDFKTNSSFSLPKEP